MNNLIVKSFLGLIFLDLVLGLALFLPAGSLAFWQAWVFLLVWTVCVLLITAYLIKYDQKLLTSRVQAGPVAETQKVQQVIQGFASLFFIGIFIVAGLNFRFHWPVVPSTSELDFQRIRGAGLFHCFPDLQGKQFYQRSD